MTRVIFEKVGDKNKASSDFLSVEAKPRTTDKAF